MGKSTISMVMFHSFLYVYQRVPFDGFFPLGKALGVYRSPSLLAILRLESGRAPVSMQGHPPAESWDLVTKRNGTGSGIWNGLQWDFIRVFYGI